MNYLIIGDDEYLRGREEVKIKENFLSPAEIELNYSVYQTDQIDDIINSLNTVPFLADKRVVLVKNVHQFSAGALEAILSYLEKPSKTSVLVLSADASLRSNKAFRKLSSSAEVIKAGAPDQLTVKKWVQGFFKKEDIDISREAVSLICELKGQDTLGIKTELEKLAAYSGGNRIEVEHVEELVGRSVTEEVFKLVDAINARDAKWAFRVLGDLYDQKKQTPEIIGYLAWYLKVMQKIILLSAKKAGPERIASELGYSAGYTRRLLKQSKEYSASRVKRWITLLLETDRDIKTGRSKPNIALESLITTFLNG